jgi:hypothetical protein
MIRVPDVELRLNERRRIRRKRRFSSTFRRQHCFDVFSQRRPGQVVVCFDVGVVDELETGDFVGDFVDGFDVGHFVDKFECSHLVGQRSTVVVILIIVFKRVFS